MSKGLAFWILMLLWLICGLGLIFWSGAGPYFRAAPVVLEFILFFLLGWATFGPPIKG